jgi:hypothetical protein
MVRQCRAPVEAILETCETQLRAAEDRGASNLSDLGSIQGAATRLDALIATVEDYRRRLTRGSVETRIG